MSGQTRGHQGYGAHVHLQEGRCPCGHWNLRVCTYFGHGEINPGLLLLVLLEHMSIFKKDAVHVDIEIYGYAIIFAMA